VDAGELRTILEEIPDAFGVMMWRAARAVDLWVRSGGNDRRAVFAEGAGERWLAALTAAAVPPACGDLLRELFLELVSPSGADPETLSTLGLRLSDWAERNAAPATAVAFAEGAALARPHVARPALVAGRLLKRRGAYARAELWLQQALSISLAASVRDWTVAAQAWSELGMVFTLRGNLRSAEASYLRAYRIAQRHHMQHQIAVALHDLFVVAGQSNDTVRAQRYVRQAAQSYYAGHPRLAAFGNDVAYFWTLQGEFACALQVFLAVLPQLEDAKERTLAAANVIRAAGGAGRREVFEDFWEKTIGEIRALALPAAQAWALLDLARGAASLGEWSRADEAASEAVQRAERYREGQTLLEAESVLDSIRRHMPVRTGAEPELAAVSGYQDLADSIESCLRRAAAMR
jgi:tetratricopeptide (TPR) repeat protein